MRSSEQFAAWFVQRNNRLIKSHEAAEHTPVRRPTADLAWAQSLRSAHSVIAAEWTNRLEAGLRLPLIDQVIDENQESDGPWKVGLLFGHGEPVPHISAAFPHTCSALAAVPGLRAAMWSVLEPGTELGEHVGHNSGVLRYHLGVSCGLASALVVGEHVIRYRDGEDVLFNDTVPHAASNRGSEPRTTLFLEVLKPLPGWLGRHNRAAQELVSRDPRYRRASARAAEWHCALNPR